MRVRHVTALACVTALFSIVRAPGQGGGAARPTAVLGAFGDEVALLEAKVESPVERRVRGLRFVVGKLGGRHVVVAQTGVGKVNAAITATLLIEHFNPREVIFSGIAGGISAAVLPGDIIIAEKTVQHDLGTLGPNGMKNWGARNPANGKRNPVFFPAAPGLVALAERSAGRVRLDTIATSQGERTPKIVKGTVATGDVFVAAGEPKAQLRSRLGADAVEMEGAAVAQVCWQLGVPCLVVRSMSDLADSNASKDYKRFYKIAARNSATLVAHMVRELGAPAGD